MQHWAHKSVPNSIVEAYEKSYVGYQNVEEWFLDQ
jgi:hypothetical protein